MFEELLNEDEVHPGQVFPKIHVGKVTMVDETVLRDSTEQFEGMNPEEVRERVVGIANERITLSPLIKT